MLTESDFANHGAPALHDFFAEAAPTQAYAKVGILGGQGDGKTHTAVRMAIGLHALCRERGLPEGGKPIAFLETSEFGLDFHIRAIEAATGLKPLHRKSVTFKDFLDGMRIAARERMILIVDTVSGFAEELQQAYRDLTGRESLTIEDLGAIGRQWAEAMEIFKAGEFHGILCGRVAFEWGHFENEATGRRELERTGLKMRGIGDTGYECSLLVSMRKQTEGAETAHPRVYRVATVLKDKSQQIDGASFDDPDFPVFRPHFEALALGGRHVPATKESSVSILRDPRTGKASWEEKQTVCDEVESLIAHFIPGQDAESKRRRGDALNRNFGTFSKERLRFLHLDALRRGYNALHVQLVGYPPVIPTRSPDWTPPVPVPAGDVAMRQGPDGVMRSAEEHHARFSAETGQPSGNGEAHHAPVPEAPPPAPDNPGPAPDVTPGPPVRRKGGRPKKNAAPPPAPAEAPDNLFPPAPADGGAVSAATTDNPAAENPAPMDNPDAKDPAPPVGGTDPSGVLAEVTAPAESPDAPPPPKRRGRPPGSKNRTAEEKAAAGAPKKRGRPPGSKNREAPAESPDAPAEAPPAPEPPPPAPTPAPPPPAPPAPPARGTRSHPADVADPGTWAGFSILAPRAAHDRGIEAPAFTRGMNATLGRARLLQTPRDRIPREFLLDFYEAISSGTWNAVTGEFSGTPAGAGA